jgi:hypothetical protein
MTWGRLGVLAVVLFVMSAAAAASLHDHRLARARVEAWVARCL